MFRLALQMVPHLPLSCSQLCGFSGQQTNQHNENGGKIYFSHQILSVEVNDLFYLFKKAPMLKNKQTNPKPKKKQKNNPKPPADKFTFFRQKLHIPYQSWGERWQVRFGCFSDLLLSIWRGAWRLPRRLRWPGDCGAERQLQDQQQVLGMSLAITWPAQPPVTWLPHPLPVTASLLKQKETDSNKELERSLL